MSHPFRAIRGKNFQDMIEVRHNGVIVAVWHKAAWTFPNGPDRLQWIVGPTDAPANPYGSEIGRHDEDLVVETNAALTNAGPRRALVEGPRGPNGEFSGGIISAEDFAEAVADMIETRETMDELLDKTEALTAALERPEVAALLSELRGRAHRGQEDT